MARFATSYVNLGCLYENKAALMRMFTSQERKDTKFSSTDGGNIEELVMANIFWKNVLICLKGVFSRIKVLGLVDSDEMPAMGFIHA